MDVRPINQEKINIDNPFLDSTQCEMETKDELMNLFGFDKDFSEPDDVTPPNPGSEDLVVTLKSQ